MSSVVIAGDTSGTVTLAAPAVAGTTTLTLPSTSGTVVTTTSGSITSSQLPTGTVLQVVNAAYATNTTTTSTTFVSTGLSASITPKSSTSKILILYTGTYYNGANNRGIRVQITRAGSSIYSPNTYTIYAGSTNIVLQQNLNYLDSPATTSSTTYAINFCTPEGASVQAQYDSNPSNITLLEISA